MTHRNIKHKTSHLSDYLDQWKSEVTSATKEENDASEKWEDMGYQYPVYEAAFSAYAKVVSALKHSKASGHVNGGANGMDDDELVDEMWGLMSDMSNSFRIGKNQIELAVDLPAISGRISWGYENSPEHPKAIADLEGSYKQLFPKFEIPDSWTTVEVKDEKRDMSRSVKVLKLKEEKATIKVSEILKDTFLEHTPHASNELTMNTPEDIEDFDSKLLRSIGYLEFTLDPENSVVVEGKNNLQSEDGTFEGLNRLVVAEVRIKVRLVLRFSKEYALWVTSATSDKDFVPANFHSLIAKHAAYAVSDEGNAPEPPERTSPLSLVIKANDAKSKALNYAPKPRVNKESFAILKRGSVYWIPEINTTTEYETALRETYDAKNEVVVPAHKAASVKNRLIYTDWMFNKLAYTNTIGNLTLLDLNGCIPLDDVTISRYLEVRAGSDFGTSYFEYLQKVATKESLFDQDAVLKDYRTSSVEQMVEFITLTNGSDFSMANVAGRELFADISTEAEAKAELYLKEIHKISAKVEKIMDADTSLSVARKLSFLKFAFALVHTYGKDHRKYKEVIKESTATNATINITPEDFSLELPNMPGLANLLHHQGSVVANLQKAPLNSILDIAPGGGKAPLQVIDAVLLLSMAKVKRCAIAMPTNLIPQFVDEINNFSGGEMNAVPITQKVVDRMAKSFEDFDSTAFVTWVKSMPRNTIFVLSTDFLKGKRDLDTGSSAQAVLYGDTMVFRWPNEELLTRCEFDFLSIDESHLMANSESQRSMALANLIASAEYKRIASGTLVNNTTTDLVGQMALLNPTIFGSKKNFVETFAETSKGDKILTPIAGASAMIRDTIRPYSNLITKRRRDWSWLLPPVKEHFLFANLSPAQQNFYDKFLEETIEEILKDPKLKKMLEEGSEDDAAAIEAELIRHFTKVETFVNAPDSNGAFAESEAFVGNEVSPKVKIVDDIIASHDTGGTVGGVHFAPDDGKIIVFGYNRVVSKHMHKHSRFNSVSVHYAAGDLAALKEFKENPDVKVMFADETSINTGFNFQHASMMIRLQSLWSPGAQDQALSRVMRPDTKTKKQRNQIDLVWMLTNNTLELAKCARLLSKIIDKARFDEADNPEWAEIEPTLATLPLVTMNLDALADFQTIGSLSEYFEAYGTYKTWEDEQFDASRDALQRTLSKKLGRKVAKNELAALSAIPVKHVPNMRDSKKDVYVPFIPGQAAKDKFNLGLIAVAYANDEESEGEDMDEVTVKKGELVYTEFGVVEVVSTSKLTVRVKLDSGSIKTLSKYIVYLPAAEGRKKNVLKKYAKNMLPTGIPSTGKDDAVEPDLPTTQKKSDPKKPKPITKDTNEEDGALWVYTGIINGKIALFAADKDGDVSHAVSLGWRYMAPFWTVRLTNFKGAERLVDILKSRFKTTPTRTGDIVNIATRLKKGKIEQVKNEGGFFADVKNFFLMQHRKVPMPKKGELPAIRAMGMVWDGEAYVLWNASTHSSKVTNQFKRLLRGKPGVKPAEYNEALAVKFYKNKRSAVTDLKALSKMVNVPNFDLAMDEIKEITIK